MRRTFFAVLAAGMLLATAHAQTTFPDVPDRHWAGDAVVRLADLGILVGFPDGTFRGSNDITRYEAALVIYRLLSVVREESAAADAAIENQVATLRVVVTALGTEIEELQRREGANRTAIDQLWAEVRALREELGLPAPAPLPDYPPEVEDEVVPADAEDGGVATPDVERPVDDAAVEPTDPQPATPDETAPDAPAEAEDAPEIDTAGATEGPFPQDDELFSVVVTDLKVYASIAGGGASPRTWVVRTTVGVDDLVADRLGARLSVDLGRRSASLLGSVAVAGHATYRFDAPEPLGAYVGAGLGLHLGGPGAFASALAGGTWSVFEPVQLFAEATLDILLVSPPAGESRFGNALVVGARWNF